MKSSTPEKLNLLIILNGSTAGEKGIGGGDQVVRKFIKRSECNPDLIVPASASNVFTPHGELFLTKKTLGSGLAPMLWLYLVRTIQGCYRAIRNAKSYDVALGASAIVVDLLPLWLSNSKRKGVIIYHLLPKRIGVNWETRIRFWLAAKEHQLARWLVSHICDFVVAGNEQTQKELKSLFPEKEIAILHAGFDADAIDRSPATAKDPNMACFMGRLTSQKGIFDLVTIVKEINKTDPSFRLVLMGGGPDKVALEEKIREAGVTSIELKGFVTDEEKYATLKQASFFLFPSYEEGWGIALAEALYCGAHCVCYELPHYKGIFEEFPTYTPLGNPAEFAASVKQLRQSSPSNLSKAIDQQTKFIRKYHDPNVVAQLLEHLRALNSQTTDR